MISTNDNQGDQTEAPNNNSLITSNNGQLNADLRPTHHALHYIDTYVHSNINKNIFFI